MWAINLYQSLSKKKILVHEWSAVKNSFSTSEYEYECNIIFIFFPASVVSEVTSSSTPSVMLRQSSWASREAVNSSGQPETKPYSFNKKLLDKRPENETGTSVSATGMVSATVAAGSLRGGFRSNRDFWNQRVAIQQKQKQTPDLVLDLPSKPKPRPRGSNGQTSGFPDSMSSSTSSSSGDETLAAEQFAKPDRNTLRKSSGSGNGRQENSSASPTAVATAENGKENSSKRIPPVQARLLQKRSPPE